MTGDSLATRQRSLGDPSIIYPLEPPLTAGCPETSTGEIQYPLDVDYDYAAVDRSLFDDSLEAGLARWQPLLPPLSPETALGTGNTPLVEAPALADWLGLEDVRVKDESANPTWSHKDRLNRCTVSAAVQVDASGIAVSSTGNHGASAAAHAARAGLPCVVFTAPETPDAVQTFLSNYGATVLAVEGHDERRRAVDRLVEAYDFHPASTRTPVHTGHPWGPEGYKTIAYELFVQCGRSVPGAVAVPTCYAELLYGVWKGFRELADLDLADRTPRLIACEPGVRAPLRAALVSGQTVASVDPAPTTAYSIKATTSTVRGCRAVRESDGYAVGFGERHLEESQHRLATSGHWQEASGAAGIAGLQALAEDGATNDADEVPVAVDADGTDIGPDALAVDGPIVAIATSSGFKNGESRTAPRVDSGWDAVEDALSAAGVISR